MKSLNKILAITAIAACGFFFGGAGIASAQSESGTINVTAENEGIFTFEIATATYDFGAVNSNGVTDGAAVGTDNGTNATFEELSASAFTITSSPTRLVRVFNSSTASTIVWGTADSLKIAIPVTGLSNGTSCGYKVFSAVNDGSAGTCDDGNLIHTLSVGNDAEIETGNVSMKLTVDNEDIVGSNSWTVSLTASAL